MQRRHQKVVEVAPARQPDPSDPRAQLCDAAVRSRKAAGYYNAGTVEFLVDVDTGECFFIEVNPRIQVEHTVTEMVTGIDLVRCQILVAQGLRAARRRRSTCRRRTRSRCTASRCSAASPPKIRRTTSSPTTAAHDLPLAGGLRHPARRRHRLTAARSSRRTYDSLLVKVTAWGRDVPSTPASAWTARLREFRIRGVKTNIPFLENLDQPPDVPVGQRHHDASSTTRRSCSTSRRARDRATKLLTYLGDVIVNGNPDVKGKPMPQARFADAAGPAVTTRRAPPAGTRQLLDELGPEKFAEWVAQAEAAAAHRHDVARRAPVAARHARAHLRHAGDRRLRRAPPAAVCSASKCGAARRSTPRCASCRKTRGSACASCAQRIPNILLPDAAARLATPSATPTIPTTSSREFVKRSGRAGHRRLPHLRLAQLAAEHAGRDGGRAQDTDAICEAAICYTGDILDPEARRSTRSKYYVKHGQGAGADGRAHPRHQGHGRPVQALRRRRRW